MKEVTPGVAASLPEDGPSAGKHLQSSILDASTLNVAEACPDVTTGGPIPFVPPHPSIPFTDNAPPAMAAREPGLSQRDLDSTLHNPTSLPVTSAIITECVDASAPLELQEFHTASPPSRGTPDVVMTGSSDQRTGSHPVVTAWGESDVPGPTFSNPPSAHVPEQVCSVHALHPSQSDNLPPSQLAFGNTPAVEASHSTFAGDSQDPGIPYPDICTGQPPVTIVDITPSSTPPRACTTVTGSTHPDPPEPMGELGHENPLNTTSSEEDIQDYLLRTSETPNASHLTSQTDGPVEPHPHPAPRTPERSTPPTIKESTEFARDPVTLPIEDPVTLPTKDSATSLIKAPSPPVANDPFVHSDEVLNSISAEEQIVSAAEDPVSPRIRESISPIIEDPVTPVKLPNPFIAENPNAQVIGESIAPQFPCTLADDPKPRSHTHMVHVVVETLNIVGTSEASGVANEATPFTLQEQDNEDELVVDAILALPSDSDAAPQPPCDTTELNDVPIQEKGETFTHTPLPEASAASPTSTEPNLTPGPSKLVPDTPSIVQRPRPHPILPQKALTPTLSNFPQDTGGATANVPLPVEPITQGSTTQPSGTRSVLKSLWSGALQEFTTAKKSLQHVFTTPRHPSPSPPADGGPNSAPSSPINEEGAFWNLDIEATQGESQTDFVQACMTGHSSPIDSQELPRSADLHRRLSLQQGTGTFLVASVCTSHNRQ